VGSGEASVAPQAGEAKLAAAHEAMLQSRGLQFSFTAYEPPKPPSWLEQLAKVFEALAPLLKWVFWAGLAAAAALILYFVARELIQVRLGRRGRRTTAGAVADWRPEPARALALLEDADRLAADGRYDEAVHLLLFRSIDDFSGRKPGAVRPALTSRDIAGLPTMPARARAAFEAIARTVEASFFAARPAGAADFAEARQAYERFAFPEVWA
jgi:hypothetical protein